MKTINTLEHAHAGHTTNWAAHNEQPNSIINQRGSNVRKELE